MLTILYSVTCALSKSNLPLGPSIAWLITSMLTLFGIKCFTMERAVMHGKYRQRPISRFSRSVSSVLRFGRESPERMYYPSAVALRRIHRLLPGGVLHQSHAPSHHCSHFHGEKVRHQEHLHLHCRTPSRLPSDADLENFHLLSYQSLLGSLSARLMPQPAQDLHRGYNSGFPHRLHNSYPSHTVNLVTTRPVTEKDQDRCGARRWRDCHGRNMFPPLGGRPVHTLNRRHFGLC